MSEMKTSIIISALDQLTGPMKKMTAAVRQTQSQLAQLGKQRAGIDQLQRLRGKTRKISDQMAKTRQRAAVLQSQMVKTGNPGAKLLAKEIQKTHQQIHRLTTSKSKLQGQTRKLGKELREARIDTGKLAQAQRHLQGRIAQTTRKLEQQRGNLRRWTEASKRARQFGRNLGAQISTGIRSVGIFGGAGGYLFKRVFLDPAIEAEKFSATLEILEGSSAKAKDSMKWVNDFGKTTPYQLEEVRSSFIKLRSYGLDPTQGLLRDLGDTAAAMGKPIIQAVEAIADAVTGENERLKEFGVKARTKGDVITYEYTLAGETKTATADARNRADIERTLRKIFSSRFAGSMDKQSKTVGGMISNLLDQWYLFRLQVMDSGLGDWIKTTLGGWLDTLNRLANSGDLDRIAKQWSDEIIKAFRGIQQFGEAAWPTIKGLVSVLGSVSGAVGGWWNLLRVVLGVKVVFGLLRGAVSVRETFKGLGDTVKWTRERLKNFNKTTLATSVRMKALAVGGAIRTFAASLWGMVPALWAATGGLWAMTVAALANPFVWIGIAIAGAAVLIYTYWEPIKAFFIGLWPPIKGAFIASWEAIKNFFGSTWEWIKSSFAKGWEFIKNLFFTFHPLGILIKNWGKIKEFGLHLMKTLGEGIQAGAKWIWDALKSAFGKVANYLFPSSDAKTGPFSRLTASGKSILGAMGQGVASAGPGALVDPLRRKLSAATAGLALTLPALALPAPIALPQAPVSSDRNVRAMLSPPPLAAEGSPARPAGVPPAASLPLSREPLPVIVANGQPLPVTVTQDRSKRETVVNYHINLTVNNPPSTGQDPRQWADLIGRELERQRDLRHRGNLYDEVD